MCVILIILVSVSAKSGYKTDTFKVLIKVVLATLSTTFEALLRTWDGLSFKVKLEECRLQGVRKLAVNANVSG
mgnify:CR=1 FL=1